MAMVITWNGLAEFNSSVYHYWFRCSFLSETSENLEGAYSSLYKSCYVGIILNKLVQNVLWIIWLLFLIYNPVNL